MIFFIKIFFGQQEQKALTQQKKKKKRKLRQNCIEIQCDENKNGGFIGCASEATLTMTLMIFGEF